MRQQGLGAYKNSGDWGWEFFPPPYQFLAPRDSAPMPAPVIYVPLPRSGPSGLGGCGCGCGGQCSGGLGLFDSGFDLTQWGVGEWVAVLGIGYLTMSLLGDVGRAGRAVTKKVAKRKYRRAKVEQLRKELEEAGG